MGVPIEPPAGTPGSERSSRFEPLCAEPRTERAVLSPHTFLRSQHGVGLTNASPAYLWLGDFKVENDWRPGAMPGVTAAHFLISGLEGALPETCHPTEPRGTPRCADWDRIWGALPERARSLPGFGGRSPAKEFSVRPVGSVVNWAGPFLVAPDGRRCRAVGGQNAIVLEHRSRKLPHSRSCGRRAAIVQ